MAGFAVRIAPARRAMSFLALLEAKRDGQALAPEAIRDLVRGYTAGAIPDYQMAAFLMAVFFRGLDAHETRALTLAMRDSGELLRFPDDPRPLVDKHSTGGVGDKVSLPLAPLLACLGLRVPMISGRGLGITGGTLDKLESIPGFTTTLPADRLVDQVQSLGCAICGQTDRMVPADKALYALRDVTGTVPSLPLITASILSKKLAESLQALVLDVKFGSAAFMQTREQARALAVSMTTLGRACGVNTRALLTDMNTPLGRAAGNWLEVKESVACLEGRGPADLEELVLACAAQLVAHTGRAADLASARQCAAACLASGEPRRKWDQMLLAQGADLEACERKLAREHTAPVVRTVRAPRSGVVTRCDAGVLGRVIRELGGGRLAKDTPVHPEVGLDALVKPGEAVSAGAVLARVHAANEADAEGAASRVLEAFAFADAPPEPTPLIVGTI
jgi:pyrimidine-nucleoside phosphorylase